MAGYIQNLRRYIGHQPLLQCGASVIVENPEGKILLQKRQDNFCWGYAGGSVELGESVEETAQRELLEETGLVADELILLDVFSGNKMYNMYPNGDEVYNIDIVFVCTKYHGKLKCQDGEVVSLEYFSPFQLPEPIFAPNWPAIEKYIESRKSNNII